MNRQMLVGSLLVTQLTACGTDRLNSDVSLIFKSSSLLGNDYRVVDFESGTLSTQTMKIIQNYNFSATPNFFQYKPSQVQLFLGQNVLSYEQINRPLPATNPYSTFELSIILPIEQDIQEFIIHLTLEAQQG
jgi:hypothetical protein